MPRLRVALRQVLPEGFVAVHVQRVNTDRIDQATTRWHIYDPRDIYCGDLVRWHKTPGNPELWSFTAYAGDGDAAFTEGSLDECVEAIREC